MTTRADIVAAARALIGTPWVHQGRNEHGVDCAGMVEVICARLGLPHSDIAGYDRRPDAASFLRDLDRCGGRRIRMADAVPGDVIAFRQDRFPCHIGVLSEKSGVAHIIHCPWRRRVLEEPLAHDLPERRIAAYVMPGIV